MGKVLTRCRGERRLCQSFVWAVDGQRGSNLTLNEESHDEWLRHGIIGWMVRDEISMICICNYKLLFCGSGRIVWVHVFIISQSKCNLL